MRFAFLRGLDALVTIAEAASAVNVYAVQTPLCRVSRILRHAEPCRPRGKSGADAGCEVAPLARVGEDPRRPTLSADSAASF